MYTYRIGAPILDSVKINGIEVKEHVYKLLEENTEILTVNHFSRFPYKIEFGNEIKKICTEIFESIKQLRKNTNEELAGKAASHIFEAFANYWEREILKKKKQLVGIEFWREILAITKEWEYESGITLHKGTPYFFLAETHLLTGDRDTAFMYLYNAINEDNIWAEFVPSLNYPDESPAYLTATMRVGSNQMGYLVNPWRDKLDEYIRKFNVSFNRFFRLEDFDSKFLSNKQLANVVYFFVFNFIYLYEIISNAEQKLLENHFSRLKVLDLIFNLCLVIDETLKNTESTIENATLPPSHTIPDGIKWLCGYEEWMNKIDLQNFWKGNLNVKNAEPDNLIPKLLSRNEKYNGNPVRKEVFTLLIAYNLRNYGGHNINQQHVLTSKFDEIIEQLLMSLFLCIDVRKKEQTVNR
jgi:hypothetical protein